MVPLDVLSISAFRMHDPMVWTQFVFMIFAVVALIALVGVRLFRHGPVLRQAPSHKTVAVVLVALTNVVSSLFMFLAWRDASVVLSYVGACLIALVHAIWPALVLYQRMFAILHVGGASGGLLVFWLLAVLLVGFPASFLVCLTFAAVGELFCLAIWLASQGLLAALSICSVSAAVYLGTVNLLLHAPSCASDYRLFAVVIGRECVLLSLLGMIAWKDIRKTGKNKQLIL